MKVIIITCSDRASRGEIDDESGPALEALLRKSGYSDVERVVVTDDLEQIAELIRVSVDDRSFRLVVTTGGTGIAERDVTPEATDAVTTKKLPGFGELMRRRSLDSTPFAALSRAQAAVRGPALVINVPGSREGAVENLEAVLHLVPHALRLLGGDTRH